MLKTGRYDWYRNEKWNPQIEEAFFAKLKRARKKDQYLKVQAYHLKDTRPEIALRLLDEFFSLKEDFFLAGAHSIAASALLALGRIDEAVEAYEAALRREEVFPNLKTNTCIELPFLIADRNLTSKFDRALEILATHQNDPVLAFPLARYMWHASKAVLLKRSNVELAREHAREALDAMGERESGFRYHQNLGLVETKITKTTVHSLVLALGAN
ncbi:MAG: hypothetical protein AAF668_12700 [Pseudomonadota bacterium]